MLLVCLCCLFCCKFYEVILRLSSEKCFVDTKKVLNLCFVAMNKVEFHPSVKCVVGDDCVLSTPGPIGGGGR